MTRLKKELYKKGITFEADEIDIIMKGFEYDTCEQLVTIDNGILITVWHSAVMDSEFHLWDCRTLEPIGIQQVYPEVTFSGSRTWWSHGCVE